MKVSELTKQAADIVQKRNAEDQAIKDREAAAVARLAELKEQAERLAHERKFDEYADNMEDQRKQNSIIELVKKISKRTPEQAAEDDKTARDFYNKAKQAFDEDTVKDFKELEEIMKKAEAVADRIIGKYSAVNEAVNAVSTTVHSSVHYGVVPATMSIPGTVKGVIGQFENLHKAEKDGKRLW